MAILCHSRLSLGGSGVDFVLRLNDLRQKLSLSGCQYGRDQSLSEYIY